MLFVVAWVSLLPVQTGSASCQVLILIKALQAFRQILTEWNGSQQLPRRLTATSKSPSSTMMGYMPLCSLADVICTAGSTRRRICSYMACIRRTGGRGGRLERYLFQCFPRAGRAVPPISPLPRQGDVQCDAASRRHFRLTASSENARC